MIENIKEKIKESLQSVLPVTLIVLLLSVTFVPIEIGTISMFLVGAILLVVGMGIFEVGAETSMTPLGESIGDTLVTKNIVLLTVISCFLIGTFITISEPDLQVLARQVASIPNTTLILSVACGVGVFLVLAVLRILFHLPMNRLLTILYIFVFIVSFFAPEDFISVAFDSGGVTTGPMTVPFIMALGVGLSSTKKDSHHSNDSFGLVAFSSIGPIMMVLLLGIFYHPSEATYTSTIIPNVITTQDVIHEFLIEFPNYTKEVLISISLIILLCVIYQFITHTFSKEQLKQLTIGFLCTIVGLILFLTGVNVGFAPVGSILGETLASSNYKLIVVPIGMLIGYYIVKAEPAVQILNQQVEDASEKRITKEMMNLCLSIGVSLAVGIAMLRSLFGINIYWILIPGYIISLVISFFVPDLFVGIAFDSGGVASGPMTTTFLLPFSMGVCTSVGGNVATDAFGIVALVALAPILSIQIMGLIYQRKTIRSENEYDLRMKDAIIDLEND